MKALIFNKVKKASNESLGMLSIRLLESISNSKISDATNSKSFESFSKINNEYQLALNNPARGPKTQELSDIDKLRNEALIDIFSYLKGQTKSRVVTTKTSAIALLGKIEKFEPPYSRIKKGDRSLRYEHVAQLLQETDSITAATSLNMKELIDDYLEFHIAYETKHKQRTDQKHATPSPSNLRIDLNRAIIDYIKEVEIMGNRSGDENWRGLLRDLENRISEITLSRRINPIELTPKDELTANQKQTTA